MKKVVILIAGLIIVQGCLAPASHKGWNIEKLILDNPEPSYYQVDKPLHMPDESPAELLTLEYDYTF